MKRPRKRVKKHWYFISRSECVLCGRSTEERERRFDKKPKDPFRRSSYEQFACPEHFL